MKKKGKRKIPPRQAKWDMIYYALSRRERDNPMVGARILAETQRRRQEMSRAEANGKGFVKEGRLANKIEANAILKAAGSLGIENADAYLYFLYGQYDAPYGWYLFGVKPLTGKPFNDGQAEKFLILGDCLDVLPDYNRLLTLKDVHNFAIGEMDGRYEVIQEWGVFKTLSMKLKTMLVDLTENDESVDEVMEWSVNNQRWELKYNVSYTTDAGAEEHIEVRIPARLSCNQEADDEFARAWSEERKAFDVDDEMENAKTGGASFDDAYGWAKSKERKIAEIDNAIRYYLETGKTDYGTSKDAAEQKQSVWVLTIVNGDNEVSPEVHMSFTGAVEGVKTDLDDCKMAQWEDIRKQLEEQMYYYDEESETTYDISLCVVGD